MSSARPPAQPASVEELTALVERAGNDLEDATAEEILRWAGDTFGRRFCVTSSLADAVLIHLASRAVPGVDVIFLDTGLHFPETLAVGEQVRRTLPVRLLPVRPELTVAEQDQRYGPRLYERDPDSCCHLRKVEPLRAVLDGYDAWAAGLRRDESPSRADTPVVQLEHARMKVKVNPLARWTEDDVDRYVRRHDVPVNPLRARGYASIGCRPCTRPVRDGEDPRAGRWAMFDKTECGLHVG